MDEGSELKRIYVVVGSRSCLPLTSDNATSHESGLPKLSRCRQTRESQPDVRPLGEEAGAGHASLRSFQSQTQVPVVQFPQCGVPFNGRNCGGSILGAKFTRCNSSKNELVGLVGCHET